MKRRFLLDNDWGNVLGNISPDGSDAEQVLAEAAREWAPNVTTHLLCANAGTCYYPTKVGNISPRSETLIAAMEKGQDLYCMMLREIKRSGRETFITMRMNDVHNPDAAEQWNTPKVRIEHPDYIVGADEIASGNATWMSYCLDYSRPEVRDYYLAIIRELIELYGQTIDGLQLDWMRFPRHLSGSPEEVWQKRQALTDFTAEVRKILRQGGAHLQLAARIPPTLEGCRNTGMDLACWTRHDLVDFLVLCPFITTNWHIPIAGFRELLGDHVVPLYGGFDFGYGSTNHHPESLRGICTSLYDCGADGIYLFNFPCWKEYLAASPYHWLAGLDNPKTAAQKPLQFSVAHNRGRKPLVDGPGELPATVAAGGSLPLTLYIPPSALPAWRCILLTHSHGDVVLTVNGAPAVPFRFPPDEHSGSEGHRSEIFLEFADQYYRKHSRPKPQDCRMFRADPAVLTPGVNHMALTNETDKELETERLNLALW